MDGFLLGSDVLRQCVFYETKGGLIRRARPDSDMDHPAWSEYAPDLGEGLLAVGHILEALVAQYDVEAGVLEWHVFGETFDPANWRTGEANSSGPSKA